MIVQYLSNLDVRITVESRIPLLLRSEWISENQNNKILKNENSTMFIAPDAGNRFESVIIRAEERT